MMRTVLSRRFVTVAASALALGAAGYLFSDNADIGVAARAETAAR
jgi:hypothetical protein